MLQCHRFDYDTPIEETMEALHDLVKSGKVRQDFVISGDGKQLMLSMCVWLSGPLHRYELVLCVSVSQYAGVCRKTWLDKVHIYVRRSDQS